jgi:two-component sensor histidine kinase/FixJ family two-component response regulator
MKILIVDDKQEARYLLELILKNRSHEVISAINGIQALKELEKNQVELIISDILMPEMDGFKFCQSLKKDEKLKNIPFIFYTATYVDKKDEEFALGLGADLFLKKPMEPTALLQEIDKLFEKIKSGRYECPELELKREEDLYKLYNERLIKKLEDKIDQLEEEVDKRTKAEMKLQKAVAEKEVLLRELYHRTRTNMQVISSMLKLYSTKILDKKWWIVVQDINSKIKTTALVHQKLYESNDLSHLHLKDYFNDLIDVVRNNYTKFNDVEIIRKIEDVMVLLDTAIPLGFVLNELLTNSYNHAFPQNAGKILVRLLKGENNTLVLQVEDNGIGLPENFTVHDEENLGLIILANIVENQLQGKFSFRVDKGTKWEIIVSLENYSERV